MRRGRRRRRWPGVRPGDLQARPARLPAVRAGQAGRARAGGAGGDRARGLRQRGRLPPPDRSRGGAWRLPGNPRLEHQCWLRRDRRRWHESRQRGDNLCRHGRDDRRRNRGRWRGGDTGVWRCRRLGRGGHRRRRGRRQDHQPIQDRRRRRRPSLHEPPCRRGWRGQLRWEALGRDVFPRHAGRRNAFSTTRTDLRYQRRPGAARGFLPIRTPTSASSEPSGRRGRRGRDRGWLRGVGEAIGNHDGIVGGAGGTGGAGPDPRASGRRFRRQIWRRNRRGRRGRAWPVAGPGQECKQNQFAIRGGAGGTGGAGGNYAGGTGGRAALRRGASWTAPASPTSWASMAGAVASAAREQRPVARVEPGLATG